jgi:hypothetical protein
MTVRVRVRVPLTPYRGKKGEGVPGVKVPPIRLIISFVRE